MAAEPWVDPDTAALLIAMAADFAGAPADPTVAQRRQGLAIAADLYGPAAAPVGSVESRVVETAMGPMPVRIYRPEGAARVDRPVLLHLHGGGWVLGDPDAYARVCKAYCAAGDCVVVDIDYRRAPEHKHPAALDDAVAALRWVHENADALGGDRRRIAVTGDSAGGHLAAALCQVTDVPVSRLILVYPVTSASALADFPSRRALGDGRYFLREFDILRAETEYFTPDQAKARETGPASPLLADEDVLARQPPTTVITAGLDPLRDEGAAYANALRNAGVDVREICFEGTIHGFVLFAGRIALGDRAIAAVGEAVRAA